MQVTGLFLPARKGLACPEFQGSGRVGGSSLVSDGEKASLCTKRALLGIGPLVLGDGTIPSTAGMSRRGTCQDEQLGALQFTPMC